MFFLLVFSNVGYLGYPLAEAPRRERAVLHLDLRAGLSDLLLDLRRLSARRFRANSASSWDILRRPCVIAALVAYALYFSALRVPVIVGQMVDYVGNLTSPMAMLIIGSALAKLAADGLRRLAGICALRGEAGGHPAGPLGAAARRS